MELNRKQEVVVGLVALLPLVVTLIYFGVFLSILEFFVIAAMVVVIMLSTVFGIKLLSKPLVEKIDNYFNNL
jgi:cobalamin biosynthesis protein CobD/CbiB